MDATSTNNSLPLRAADFSTLAEALDYAAQGETGYNFYSGRNELYDVLPYAQLRDEAIGLAHRLCNLGLERNARVALVAETTSDFPRFFFACQYAGLVPVPLPVSIGLGNHKAFVGQLRGLLINCRASIAIAPTGLVGFVREAAQGLGLRFLGDPDTFRQSHDPTANLPVVRASDVAYLQYTSGSTRFPRGVMISQQAVLSNLSGIIQHGVKIRRGDRCVSWLPFYHDMGLVGLVLGPLASQTSADYLSTREFAMRPRRWLELMTQSRATISFSPPFGYELCARRLRTQEASQFDLSAWRVAGVGAETIRPEPLARFARSLAPSGFNERAFLAGYGMAECSLAVSFAPLDEGLKVDRVDGDHYADHQEALPLGNSEAHVTSRVSTFVDCGRPLPDYEFEVRDGNGQTLPERRSGTVFVRGPSVMSGYFGDAEATRQTLSRDGWLDTGDVGYHLQGSIVITGRKKDIIIINGRNILPQDLEFLAEQQPEVRFGDALAFAAPDADGGEKTVMVVQSREGDEDKRANLVNRLQRLIRMELGIECFVELVPLHTLPRTSSGKLSRTGARRKFIERHSLKRVDTPIDVPAKQLLEKQAV